MTAVNWMIEKLIERHSGEVGKEYIKIFEQAKEMEKQQIEDAHIEGQRVFDTQPHSQWTNDQAEIYYNETYGSKGSDGNFKQFSLYEHKETIATADTPTYSQKEISDEDIYEEADYQFRHFEQSKKDIWVNACKWYREQLKKKQ